ncbi:MAG: hypothetical protein ACRD5D_00560 [Candidatus Polarisedimenticolia bacterium]
MSDYALAQRGVTTVTVGDTSPKDVTLASPIKTGAAQLHCSIRESRIPALPEPDLTLEHRGATCRILNSTTIRIEWNGTLSTDAEAGNETITVAWEVWDIESLGDDVQEILFRLQRILGIQGENSIQDLMTYDQAGNPTQFRVRTFDTKVDAEAATVDLPSASALEAGELDRHLVTLEWSTAKNRPKSILSVRTHLLAPTPGVT